MTIVEFFNRIPLENIISAVTTDPDKIIFIGDGKQMERTELVYWHLLDQLQLDNTDLDFIPVKTGDLDEIIQVLTEIVETEEDLVFDLTGGEDLALVAMGIIYERYKDTKNIQMQRYNIRSGVVTDCDNDGNVVSDYIPEISVDEMISVHGGKVRHMEDGGGKGTYDWIFTDGFMSDIEKMWEICKQDPGKWNTQANALGHYCAIGCREGLDFYCNLNDAENRVTSGGNKFIMLPSFLNSLRNAGLISRLEITEKDVTFRFKDEQVKKCLTKAGLILELKVLIAGVSLENKDGTPYYTSFMNGVHIDWDGEIHFQFDEDVDVENEIDVVFMKGMIPVFISCKNGQVDVEELYKLDAVASRFGGPYAKKIVVATYLGKDTTSARYFLQRAQDMDIHVEENVHLLDDKKFSKMIKNLVNT